MSKSLIRDIIAFLIYIQLFVPVFVFATADSISPKTDSLILELEKEVNDSTRYRLLSVLIKEIQSVDRAAAVPYLNEKYYLAVDFDDPKKISDCASDLGSNYLYLGNSDSSLYYLLISNEYLLNKTDTKSISDLNNNLNNLALVYQRTNNYEESVETYQKVIIYSEKLNDYIGELFAYVNLMSLYMDLKDSETALEYFYKSIDLFDRIPSGEAAIAEEAKGYYSAIYLNGGQLFQDMNQIDSAQYYLDLADLNLGLIENEYAQTYYRGYVHQSIGENKYKIGEKLSSSNRDSAQFYFNESLEYFTSAYDLFTAIEEQRGIIFTLNDLGMANNSLGNLNTANGQLRKALKGAQDLDFNEEIRDAYQRLADNSKLRGDFKNAFFYLEKYDEYKETIINDERSKFTRASEVKNQTLRKEQQIVEMALEQSIVERQRQKQNTLYLMGFIVFLGLAVAAFARFRFIKEREKTSFEKEINKAMARFVPMDFIRAIGYEKIQDAKLGDQVEKEVTVLFTDIRDFTTISEAMTPKENFAFVKDYVERMGPIIERNGGFISQYLGDGIMAIFQNNPADALVACIEMQDEIEQYNQFLESNGSDSIRVGMGMHTGPLIMGIIGDDMRREPTLISDTVNTAARIESTTKQLNCKILLSEEALSKIEMPQMFDLEERGEVQVKGKTKPISVFECKDRLMEFS